ncbi:hypothetical protein F4703DRAFT_1417534, partial [Phycomyces blakesleeanus]
MQLKKCHFNYPFAPLAHFYYYVPRDVPPARCTLFVPALRGSQRFEAHQKSSSNLKKALCGTFALVSTTTTLFSVNQVYGHKPPHPAAHQNTRTSNSLAQITIAELQDNESQAAVSQKSTRELVLAYAVYQLCTLPWLVDASPCLINLASQSSFSFLIKDPIYWVIKNTFFRQFCGGETAEECQPIMERLEKLGS